MGSNLNPIWERFLAPFEGIHILLILNSLFNRIVYFHHKCTHDLFIDDCKQCQHTSSPLGNGAVVETSDNKILLLQRSNNVGEFPGYLVFPGGHPEVHYQLIY